MTFRWLALVALTGTMWISLSYRRRARQTGDVIARRREGPAMILARLAMASGGYCEWRAENVVVLVT